ncbi:DUF86 domain-containing protein [Candidatus Omnitrophota bacterium]
MTREYKDYLMDIIGAIERIEEFTHGITAKGFEKDEKTIFAVIRALEVIGEAAKKIPLPVRKKYSQIPWLEITGMRNKLIHEYFGVNVKVIWNTVKEDIPSIKPLIKQIAEDIQ